MGEGLRGVDLINNHQLSVIREFMPSNTAETKHFIPKRNNYLLLLKERLVFNINNDLITVKSGESIFIEAGESHQIKQIKQGGLTFIVISTPSTINGPY